MKTNIEMYGPKPTDPCAYGWSRRSYWDCFPLQMDGDSSGLRLFGQHNIGNHRLTNLQVAGNLSGDEEVRLHCWYLRIPYLDRASAEDRNKILRILELGIATLNTGDYPLTSRPLVDLVETPHPLDWVKVPNRQNVAVYLSLTPDSVALARTLPPERVLAWVHLEGWSGYTQKNTP